MAFPAAYTKYQPVTVDHLKVAADLTDYVIYVNLADLVKAGADIFDTCRSDGGDIRVTKSDGVTEVPVEVVAIDTTAKTGELHIKYSGTLSSTTDTVLHIHYNGIDTLPAVAATYGRNNVWSDYQYVYHLNGTVNSTGSTDLTNTGSTPFGAAKVGNGAEFNTTNNRRLNTLSNMGLDWSGSFTWQQWIKVNAFVGDKYTFDHMSSLGSKRFIFYSQASGGNGVRAFFNGNEIKAGSLSAGVFYKLTAIKDASTMRLYRDAVSQGTTTLGTLTYSGFNTLDIGASEGGFTVNANATIDEVRGRITALSANWETTEYNNQNSASTFYAAGAELSGSTIVSPLAQALTSSTPTPSLIYGRTVAASTQTATANTVAPVVTGASLVSVNANTATFTIPAYTVLAGGIQLNPSAQELTFTVQTADILAGSVTPVGAVALTVQVPVSSVTGAARVSVNPAVFTLSVPALTFIGSIWGRTARQTTGEDWTRSSVNNDA